MDKDYDNFVQRMGSFEDTIELEDIAEKITHSALDVIGDELLISFELRKDL